jgi:hypothetical protein
MFKKSLHKRTLMKCSYLCLIIQIALYSCQHARVIQYMRFHFKYFEFKLLTIFLYQEYFFYLILRRVIVIEKDVAEACTREHTMEAIAPQKLQVSYFTS